jgi:hypothetical protein
MNRRILLIKPPFFSPWTPPLGIALISAYLKGHGYEVDCFDFNPDSKLWGTHHQYFAVLQSKDGVSKREGYSKLWWVLNAHMLAHANGANASEITRVLKSVVPLYRLPCDDALIQELLPIVDRYFERLAELIDNIDLSDVKLVGTSTYSTSLASSLFFLRRIKERFPQVITVIGGGVFADDLAFGSDNLQTLVDEYSFIDHVILGEGELLLHRLLEGELAGERVISISSIKGQTLNMKEVPLPDFSDFNLDRYQHLTIEGARSCPFQCKFCSETVQWGDYRKKSQGQLADQVVQLSQRYRNRSFFMGDSLMNPYIAGFASDLLERQSDILYDGYLRADKPVADHKRVKEWARSGLYRVRLGIESGSEHVLQMMDKMTTPATISAVLKSLADAGVRTTTYWIVGYPGETKEDFQETLDFIAEHHRHIYELEAHPYKYYPYGQIGSRLFCCYSLYDDEVTDLIKFREWELAAGEPGRDEKFDRLSRISQLAVDLGIPNIYTMQERFEAEQRWFALQPGAVEVYGGSRNAQFGSELPSYAPHNWDHDRQVQERLDTLTNEPFNFQQ